MERQMRAGTIVRDGISDRYRTRDESRGGRAKAGPYAGPYSGAVDIGKLERIRKRMLSLEGKQLGNYDVIRRIRVGGMGAVYEGRQRTAFDRRVAIKVILGNYAEDRDMRRRFAREARTVARLHHPHILPLIEFGDEGGVLYLVMPFIDGGTLTSHLRRSLPDLGEVAAIYQQLLDAVEYAHDAGLIHRDIKSSNVLLEMRRSGPPYVYLADFGLVRTLRQGESEQVGKAIPLDQVPGTPHYMAPEQTRGIVTIQTDIYALGVMLYQLLTGELPYNDDDDVRVIQMHLSAPIPLPGAFDSSIPPELDEVVKTAMAKRQEDRYKTVAELRSAFFAAINGPVETVSDQEVPGQSVPSSRRLTGTRALQPLPPPAHLSTKLDPRLAPNAKARTAGTRELNGREPGIRNVKGRDAAQRNQDVHNVRGRNDDTETRKINPRNAATRELNPRNAPISDDAEKTHDFAYQARPNAATSNLPPGSVRDINTRAQLLRSSVINDDPSAIDNDLSVIDNRTRSMDAQKNRTRTTEEPIKQPRRRGHIAIFAGIVVPVIFIMLLVMPHILGISLFPSGFPLFGTAPIATILITAQSKTVQDKYVLTASPEVKVADLNAHTIPANQLKGSISAKRTVPTSGTRVIPGIQARGTVELINTSNAAAFVPAQTQITTSTGMQFLTVQDAQIPAGKRNNTLNVTVIAVDAGAAGNIAAYSLNGACCGTGISVKNNAPFSGGIDPQTTHVVDQADLNSVQSTLAPNLESQLAQQLLKRLANDQSSIGTPIYSVNTTSDNTIDTQTDQVRVTVTVTGTLNVYSRSLASNTATQLLMHQAIHELGNTYQLQNTPVVGTISIVGTSKNGSVYLSVPAQGTWMYALSSHQINNWPQYIKGATSAAALAYLNTQPGVAGVEIHLPFGADHLPASTSEIRIVLVG